MPEFLPFHQREVWVYNTLLGWLGEGRSASSLYERIKGTELGMRQSTFFGIARLARESVPFWSSLRDAEPGFRPRRKDIPVWPYETRGLGRYRVRVGLDYEDVKGRSKVAYGEVFFDRLDSLGGMLDILGTDLDYLVEEAEGVVTGRHVEMIWRVS